MSEYRYVEQPILGWLCGEPKPPKGGAGGLGWTYRDEAAMATYDRPLEDPLVEKLLVAAILRINQAVKTEAQAGLGIRLNGDGSITLQPGVYRISGVSTVTTQTTLEPAPIRNKSDYPGYALVYPVAAEKGGLATIQQAIAIGTPATATFLAPSVFDGVYTTSTEIDIAVGHQSGAELHDEVYLSIYDVDGVKSVKDAMQVRKATS